MGWLDDHPPRRSQFRQGRRARVRPVIVGHTAESPWPSSSALSVARFIQGRGDPGSYHELVDAGQVIDLVDLGNEAYQDGTGSNPWAYGLSAACRTVDWARMPADTRQRFLRNLAIGAARCNAHSVASGAGRVEPRRITRAQSNAGVAGFIPHGDRDPGRRSDWGTLTSAPFPWAEFWPHYLRAIAHPHTATPPLEDPLMADTLSDDVAKQIRTIVREEVQAQGMTTTAAVVELLTLGPLGRWARQSLAYARSHARHGAAEAVKAIAAEAVKVDAAELAKARTELKG